MLVVRGEQQEVGKEGQTIDDLRIIKNKSFVELVQMKCRNSPKHATLWYGGFVFAALKMKPKSNDEPRKTMKKYAKES